jgi:hypothetical protein
VNNESFIYALWPEIKIIDVLALISIQGWFGGGVQGLTLVVIKHSFLGGAIALSRQFILLLIAFSVT